MNIRATMTLSTTGIVVFFSRVFLTSLGGNEMEIGQVTAAIMQMKLHSNREQDVNTQNSQE
jgi:hypothetical protein